MINDEERPGQAAEPRRQAEKSVREKAAQLAENLQNLSPEEMRQALNELRARRIELEMQNEELQAEHTLLLALMENIPDHVYFKDTASRFLRVNSAMARLFGFRDPVEAVGKTDADFFSAEHADQARADEEEIMRTGRPRKTIEEKETWPDGSVSWVVTTKLPLRDPEGRIIGTCGISSDITERKQAEKALHDSEALYQSLVSNLPQCILRKDLEGRFTFGNQNYCRLLGKTPAEIQGLTDFDLFPNYLAEKYRQDDQRVLQERLLLEQVEEHVLTDGGKLFVQVVKTPLVNAAGEVVGVQAIFWDITERKRAEAEKEKLEALNRQLQKSESLGRMAGAIAHHFNNQLQAVSLNLEMAVSELSRPAGRPAEFLTEALQATRDASEVSSMMLTYRGQTCSEYEPLDLSDACRGRLRMLQAAMPKNVVLESNLPSPGPVVSANANQIQQVLVNLVTNALEACDGTQPVIHISVKTAMLSDISESHRFPLNWQPQHHAYSCLEVADTGCGIAAKDFDNLFDPYFSSKFTGRGMGLAVILGIVQAHEGAITVESEPGRGSIFRAYFPLTAESTE